MVCGREMRSGRHGVSVVHSPARRSDVRHRRHLLQERPGNGRPRSGPVGDVLVEMCLPLFRRGPDSTGFALYGEPRDGAPCSSASTSTARTTRRRPNSSPSPRSSSSPVKDWRLVGRGVRLEVGVGRATASWPTGSATASPAPGSSRSGGRWRSSRTSGPRRTSTAPAPCGEMTGTHGIGHTRMATESRVDIAHSHPFWARPFPDIAVVHNGTITNYHQLRRRLEMKGHRFSTQNDSEVIAVYIADRLQAGRVPGGGAEGLDHRPGRSVRLPDLHRPRARPGPRPVRHETPAVRRERRAGRARLGGDRHPHACSPTPPSCPGSWGRRRCAGGCDA